MPPALANPASATASINSNAPNQLFMDITRGRKFRSGGQTPKRLPTKYDPDKPVMKNDAVNILSRFKLVAYSQGSEVGCRVTEGLGTEVPQRVPGAEPDGGSKPAEARQGPQNLHLTTHLTTITFWRLLPKNFNSFCKSRDQFDCTESEVG